MKKVIGIGGVFFKCQDHQATKNWYQKHLGIQSEDWGAVFPWRRHDRPEEETYTAWSPFRHDTTYFAPGKQEFMVNYQVADLHALLAQLRQEGVQVLEKTEESEFGKFGWAIDPDGRKIELWEPPQPAQKSTEE